VPWKFASGVKVTVPSGLRTTEPFEGFETAEMTKVSPSRSVSLGVTMSLMLRTRVVSSSVETVVVDRDWSVVDRADIDRHRGGVSAAIAVADGIIKGGSAVEVCVRGKGDGSVGVEDDTAIGCVGNCGDNQRIAIRGRCRWA